MALFSQLVLAREMAVLGFIPKIISSETGLSIWKLRRIYKELKTEGHCVLFSKPGKDPTAATLVKNLNLKRQASFAMQVYCLVDRKNIHHSVNTRALRTAYDLYQAASREIEEVPGLDINDLWHLAREIREGLATVEHCQHCSCGYFHSVHQRMHADCPFCGNHPLRKIANFTPLPAASVLVQ